MKSVELVRFKNLSVQKAILSYGLTPAKFPAATLQDGVLGSESHEPGPYWSNITPLGIVEASAGKTRMSWCYGFASHAGTNAMSMRAMRRLQRGGQCVEKEAISSSWVSCTVGALEASLERLPLIARGMSSDAGRRHALGLAARTQSVSDISKRGGKCQTPAHLLSSSQK